jgi:hypothetical protein
MPKMRTLLRVPVAPMAAEVLEVRQLLAAKTPIVDAAVAGTVNVEALGETFNVTGRIKGSGHTLVGKKFALEVTINAPGGILSSALKFEAKLKVTGRTVVGDTLTLQLAPSKKSLSVPVSFGGNTFKFSAAPKEQPVQIQINTQTKTVVAFNAGFLLQKIPTFTTGPTSVDVNLSTPVSPT